MWTLAVCCLTLALVVVLDIARRYVKNTASQSSYPLPPGPRGLPFIGKVIGVNPDAPWLMYAEWAKQYGNDLTGVMSSAQVDDSRRPYLYPKSG